MHLAYSYDLCLLNHQLLEKLLLFRARSKFSHVSNLATPTYFINHHPNTECQCEYEDQLYWKQASIEPQITLSQQA